MMENDGVLDVETLPLNFLEENDDKIVEHFEKVSTKVISLKELEKNEILKAINIYGNNTDGKKKAAKDLGIGLATLYRKIEEYSK